MEQVRPLTSLSQDELIARIEQYIVVVELRDAEIRELYAVNSALLAERDALRDALKQYASPENWEQDEHGWSRLWLEPDSTSRRSYDGFELAFSALAQGEA